LNTGVCKYFPRKCGDFLELTRSAYRLALEIQEKETVASLSSNPGGDRKIWVLIWKAKVPPKVHVFGWKLTTNTLGVQAIRHTWIIFPLAAFVEWSRRQSIMLW
jgi:hypothetical protein